MTFSYYAICKTLLIEQGVISEHNAILANEPPEDIDLQYCLIAGFEEKDKALLYLALNIINMPHAKFHVTIIDDKVGIYAYEKLLDKDIYLCAEDYTQLLYGFSVVNTLHKTINTEELIGSLLRTVIAIK